MHVALSEEAEDDLDAIAAYTYETWGDEQAIWYVTGLREACLVALPQLLNFTRPVAGYPGVRRFGWGSHFVFFTEDEDGLRVERILHERMLPELHL